MGAHSAPGFVAGVGGRCLLRRVASTIIIIIIAVLQTHPGYGISVHRGGVVMWVPTHLVLDASDHSLVGPQQLLRQEGGGSEAKANKKTRTQKKKNE